MRPISSNIRVEQWTAAHAQAECLQAQAQQKLAKEEDNKPSAPSLLETLRAAAATAEEKAKGNPQEASASLAEAGHSKEVDQEPRKAPNSQISDSTQVELAASKAGSGAGRVGLHALAVRKHPLKQKASLPGPESPDTPCSVNAQIKQRCIHKARTELRTLEESIPWVAVHESWKERRQPWRKALRQAETVAELLQALNELRKAICVKEGPFSSSGCTWDQQMRACLEKSASIEDVSRLVGDLRSNAKQWARPKQKEFSPTPALDCSRREYSHEHKATAMLGLEALWKASQAGPSALLQCPLEAILDYDLDTLRVLHQLLEKELFLLASGVADGRQVSELPSASMFSQLCRKPSTARQCSPAVGANSSGETQL